MAKLTKTEVYAIAKKIHSELDTIAKSKSDRLIKEYKDSEEYTYIQYDIAKFVTKLNLSERCKQDIYDTIERDILNAKFNMNKYYFWIDFGVPGLSDIENDVILSGISSSTFNMDELLNKYKQLLNF